MTGKIHPILISLIVGHGFFFGLIPSLQALPENPEVVSGDVTFERVNDTTLHVTASDQSIIDYTSFDIGENETVRFFLPEIDASSLNRVIGEGGTEILGRLTANGNLFLVDPHGIFVGPSAEIETGGLVASTLDIKNEDFLRGYYLFGNIAETEREFSQILNQGNIRTRDEGFAILIASALSNEGTIQAPVGAISLASGDLVAVGISEDGMISVGIEKPVSGRVFKTDGDALSEQISNQGVLEAQGGIISLEAQAFEDIFHEAINHEGIMIADSAQERNGVVELTAAGSVQSSGIISAKEGDIVIQAAGESTLGEIRESKNLYLRAHSSREAVYTFQSQSEVHIGQEIVIEKNVTLNASDLLLEIGGNLTNRGIFNGDLSAVLFSDAAQLSVISGDNTFYNFLSLTPGKKLAFEAGAVQTVLGEFRLQGEPGRLIEIHSTDPGGIQWQLDPRGMTSVQYVHLGDAWNLSPQWIKAIPSNSFGNNTHWDTDPVWDGGGVTNNWSEALNWDTNVAPGSKDTVTFNDISAKDSVVDSRFGGTIANLNIASGYLGTITLARSLTVNGNFSQAGGTFNAANQILDLNGTFNLSGGIFIASSSTASISGNFTHSGGNFIPNLGTVIFDGASATIDVPTFETLNHLTINSTGSKTIASGDTLVVLGNLTLTNGNINTGTVEAQGNVVHGAAFDGGSGKILVTGGTARSIELTPSGQMPGFTLHASNVAIFGPSAGLVTFDGAFLLEDGAFIGRTGDIEFNNSFTLSGGEFLAPSGTMFVSGKYTHLLGGIFNPNQGTVVFDGASATLDVAGLELFHNLTFNSSVSKIIASGDTLAAQGTLTLARGKINTGTLEAQGNVIVLPAFGGGSASLFFRGTSDQTFDLAGAENLFAGDILVEKDAGTVTLFSDLWMNALGQDLTIHSGVFDLAGKNLTVSGILTLTGGTLVQGSGSLTAHGYTQMNGTFSGGLGIFDVNGPFSLAGGIFSAPFDIQFSGDSWTRNGGTFIHNNGTVIFDSETGMQTLNSGGSHFYNLVHTGDGILELSGDLTLEGSVTQSGGTFNGSNRTVDINGNFIQTGGIFRASSGITTLAGDFSHLGGDFIHNGGTFIFDGGNQILQGQTVFNHFTKIAFGPAALIFPSGLGNEQTIAGTLTLQGMPANLLLLRSSIAGALWRINPLGPRFVSLANVQDSENMNPNPISCFPGCVNSGNNVNWIFPRPRLESPQDMSLLSLEDEFRILGVVPFLDYSDFQEGSEKGILKPAKKKSGISIRQGHPARSLEAKKISLTKRGVELLPENATGSLH
jgi:filamentous hemagglutinin family protein